MAAIQNSGSVIAAVAARQGRSINYMGTGPAELCPDAARPCGMSQEELDSFGVMSPEATPVTPVGLPVPVPAPFTAEPILMAYEWIDLPMEQAFRRLAPVLDGHPVAKSTSAIESTGGEANEGGDTLDSVGVHDDDMVEEEEEADLGGHGFGATAAAVGGHESTDLQSEAGDSEAEQDVCSVCSWVTDEGWPTYDYYKGSEDMVVAPDDSWAMTPESTASGEVTTPSEERGDSGDGISTPAEGSSLDDLLEWDATSAMQTASNLAKGEDSSSEDETLASNSASFPSSELFMTETSWDFVDQDSFMAEPVSIDGMGARFGVGASSWAKYLQGLAIGADGAVEIPLARWDINEYYDENADAIDKMYARHGSFIQGAEQFDIGFFTGEQRLLLELSFHGLAVADQDKKSPMGNNIGVWVGQAKNGRIQMQTRDCEKITPYTDTGASASISAGRISIELGLKGPSCGFDTACSSALVAFESAVSAVRRSCCDAAVTCGVNLLCSPSTYISLSKPRMLSSKGRCFTFDASADGYMRGEGGGSAVLQKMGSDRVQALALGAAVNQDGRSATMTAPNGPSQSTVIKLALEEARMTASEVSSMECHGIGTPLGDAIETGGLQAINRERYTPLCLAAVKTNVGHVECGAGSTGIVKCVMALRIGISLPTLHVHTINPHITGLASLPKLFNTESLAGDTMKSTGLSSFGFRGTNAHAVFAQEQDAAAAPVDPSRSDVGVYQSKPLPWCEAGLSSSLGSGSTSAFSDQEEEMWRQMTKANSKGPPKEPKQEQDEQFDGNLRELPILDRLRNAATTQFSSANWNRFIRVESSCGGEVKFWEFVRSVRECAKVGRQAVSDAELRLLFNHLDVEGSGSVPAEDLVAYLRHK